MKASPPTPLALEPRSTEERMRSIVDHVVDGIISIDEAGTITTFNPAAERIFGYASAQAIGQNVRMLMPEPYHSGHDAYIQNYQRTGVARIIGIGREVLGKRSDGSVFPMELAISEFRVDGERHFTGIVRDVTERKHAEQARQQAEERMRSVVDNVLDGIITIDRAGSIQSFNPAAERLFGYAASEVVGHNVNMLMPQPWHTEHDRYLENYLRTERPRIIGTGREVLGRRRDGSTFPMELAVSEFRIGADRFFTGIVRDITERKRMETELHEHLRELGEADRQKNEFLAMLGHELRNPLAPMRNAVHILRSAAAPPEMRDRARDIIDRQLNHMVRLVDDLLDVSRIVRGKVELQTQRLDLREPVQRAWETAQPVLDAHGKSVHPSLPEEPVWVEGDMVRLSQVVANLLVNAAKYSGANAQVFLELRVEGDRAIVGVRDTGAGMSAELVPRVFDLFVQGDRTAERAQGGLGIGLTLVRRLVDMHGGSVQAHSGGAGQGSAFIVDLPLAAAPADEGSTAPGVDDAAAAQARGRVLVVDDNVDACESIAMILDAFGYEVQCLHDGASVLPQAAQWQPHAIVLDIGLPGISGLQVAALLRDHPELRSTPLIALTGYGQLQDQERSQQAGFNLHLTKPVDPQRLLHSLAQLMADA